jgi:hypothetical protein
MHHTPRAGLVLAGLIVGISAAQAGVPAAEAAKHGKTLTPIGAEVAGNKDGSIPAFQGRKIYEGKDTEILTLTRAKLEDYRNNKPDELEDRFKKAIGPEYVNPQFEISKANMAQYASKLTEGHKAMLRKYPTFKMKVYKSVRPAFFPKEVESATMANATSASLTGTDNVQGATLGFPFPIPKTGAEVIWNHKLKYRGTSVKRYNNQAIVKPDGSISITKLVEDVKFKYANLKEQPWDGKLYTMYMSEAVAPASKAGQIVLAQETSDFSNGGRTAYIYSPGTARVTRAPDVGYDNPALNTDNEQYNDQIDVFNGSLDRYNWKLLGKKEMYIPYNSLQINSPKLKYKDILKPFHVNPDYARFELHRVWVVEATLKPGLRHNFAKRVFYVDEDSWSIAVVDCYDGRGDLWKVQEAHLLALPFIPTVTGIPELIYDLQSNRYFATTLTNEDPVSDFEATYDDKYFTPANLKRKSKSK